MWGDKRMVGNPSSFAHDNHTLRSLQLTSRHTYEDCGIPMKYVHRGLVYATVSALDLI